MTYGQNSKINVGLEFTPTITSLGGKSMISNSDSRMGISTGLSVERFLNSNISIKSGLNYERKGSKTSTLLTNDLGELIGTQELKLNFNYLTLPILISSSTEGKTKFYINAGPFFGFLISHKRKVSAVAGHPKNSFDDTESMKRIDLGFSLGCGLNIPFGDAFLLDLGLRDNMGLFNIDKNGSIKTNSYGFQLGIKYSM